MNNPGIVVNYQRAALGLKKQEVDRGFEKLGLKLLDDYTQKEVICNIRCYCVKIFKTSPGSIFQGKTKSCGCKKNRKNKNSPLWKGFEDIPAKLFTKIKRGARTRNLEYNLTPEYLWNLFLKQNKRCIFSGVELIFDGSKDFINNTASLDRIDSSKEYIEGNVQWVHKDINFMKQDYSDDYFIEMCKLVSKNRVINE